MGILGGTFDPIHEGHIAVGEVACSTLRLDQLLAIPTHHPPHRRTEPHASGYHRFAMVALATIDHERFVASDVELLANDWSYTSLTLRRLHRSAFDALQLFFITGADAFADIATWKDYPTILDLAHFVVVSRPRHPAAAMPAVLPTLADRMIIGPDTGPRTERTSAAPAGALVAGRTRIWLIDAPTPDVSSTEIRQRVHDGQSISGMVPLTVEEYIRRHHLYEHGGTTTGS